MGLREKILFALTVALAVALVGYTLLGPGGGKRAQLKAELEKLQDDNHRLSEQIHRLKLEVDALKNRPDYQEKVVREELGLVRPDEVIVRLPAPVDGGSPAGSDAPR